VRLALLKQSGRASARFPPFWLSPTTRRYLPVLGHGRGLRFSPLWDKPTRYEKPLACVCLGDWVLDSLTASAATHQALLCAAGLLVVRPCHGATAQGENIATHGVSEAPPGRGRGGLIQERT
jgi:hypothetical protein